MGYTFMNIDENDAAAERLYRGGAHWKLWFALFFIVLLACFLHWGGYLLEASDSLPEHVDAAVVLQGSNANVRARVAAAMALLQQGSADRVALSVPNESPWGEETTPIARQYLEKTYGAELAGRVDVCETAGDVNSAEQEAQVVGACVQEHGWKTIALVTSNYDGRRAEMVWRKAVPLQDPPVRVAVDGVADPVYQPRGWWRQRLSAKIWVMEFTQLVWAIT